MPRKKLTPPTEEELEAALPLWEELALATGPETLTGWLLDYFTNNNILGFERWETVDEPPGLAVTHGSVFAKADKADDGRVEVTDEATGQSIFTFKPLAQSKSVTWLTIERLDYDFIDALRIMEASALRRWQRVEVSELPRRGAYVVDPEDIVRKYMAYRASRKASRFFRSETRTQEEFCTNNAISTRTLLNYEKHLNALGRYNRNTKELLPPDP